MSARRFEPVKMSGASILMAIEKLVYELCLHLQQLFHFLFGPLNLGIARPPPSAIRGFHLSFF